MEPQETIFPDKKETHPPSDRCRFAGIIVKIWKLKSKKREYRRIKQPQSPKRGLRLKSYFFGAVRYLFFHVPFILSPIRDKMADGFSIPV